MAKERGRNGFVRELVSEGELEKRSEKLKNERDLIANVAFTIGWKKRKSMESGSKEKTWKVITKPMLLKSLCGKLKKRTVLDSRDFRSSKTRSRKKRSAEEANRYC